jgi:hypothetical protein
MLKVIQELRVHQIELEMQNNDLPVPRWRSTRLKQVTQTLMTWHRWATSPSVSEG